MRIAVAANGSSVHTERWVDLLSARGHEMLVVWEADDLSDAALARYRPEVQHIVRDSLRTRLRGRSSPTEALSPHRVAARFKPDLVQGMYLVRYGWTAAELGHPLVQFAWGTDVVALAPWHDKNPYRAAAGAYYKLRTLHAVRRADLVLCDSAPIGETVKRSVPGSRVELIRIGVEVTHEAHSARAWRTELGLSAEAFVLLSTRLFRPNYNIDAIIRSFAVAAAANPDLVLVLKDFDSVGDPEYRERCWLLIRELAMEERIRTVGELERPDLLALYRAADAFVSVPSRDAMAVSVLEAMAACVPVIASRTEGMDPEMLRDRVSALLVNPGDERGLSNAITELATSPALCEVLARNGRETVAAFGDLDRELDRTETLYAEVIDRQRGRRRQGAKQ